MGLHDEARLDRKFVEFAKQMNLYLNHFPKHEKYGLAQEIRRKLYECYGLVVEAQKRYHKKTTLTSLDIAHEQLPDAASWPASSPSLAMRATPAACATC